MSPLSLEFLPPQVHLETPEILKKVNEAHRELATLNDFSKTFANPHVLMNVLSLQEAKDSSEIERIITTYDALYQYELFVQEAKSPEVEEVRDYAEALMLGFERVQKGATLSVDDICSIQQRLEGNYAGIRTQPGTVIMNPRTGKVIHRPPQSYLEILDLMRNLEQFINEDDFWPDIDPLIKMAVIHYQFESIHPFYDGNGRTGRIVNVLYLVLKKLLDLPILPLSWFINHHKVPYYRLLRSIQQDENRENYEAFVLYMLDAVLETSKMTVRTIQEIHSAMQDAQERIQGQFKFYSRDLLDSLFLFPYTRIQHLQERLQISRNTATSYLNGLTEIGILEKYQKGRNVYFVNANLFRILSEIPKEME